MIEKYKYIGLFINGGYYAKINEALEGNLSLNINVGRLMTFVREKISEIGNSKISDCRIT